MKLNRINISNFRSIKDGTINFTNNCLILVGDNATGKSNTLKAIVGGLGNKNTAYQITQKDKRKRLPNEGVINNTDFYIRYIFKLSKNEIDSILEAIEFPNDMDIFETDEEKLSYRDFVYRYFSEGLWKYNIYTNTASATRWKIADDIKIIKNIYRVKTAYTTAEGENIPEGAFLLEQNENTGEALTLTDFENIVADNILEYIKMSLPDLYYWKYDTNQLLPSSISIAQFSDNPNICEPLKNIFKLAGYNDIKRAFQEAVEQDGHNKNLLTTVSVIATKSFSEKWRHFKDTEICLSPDGENMLITVKRKTEYSMSEESDGFKRFVSILLLLSTKVDTKDITNALIVIDEPDNSLSPSGCKDLKNLLLKMADNNFVIYSTHSPFMIDNKNIGRHIILERDPKTEVTTFTEATEDKYSQNEVLLHAIGTSVFDFISDTNILFEGWGDSTVFRIAVNSERHKKITKKFKDMGISFAHGCRGIKHVTPMFAYIKDKKIIIFTDSDEASVNAKKAYIEQKGFQAENWFTFEDLGGEKNETIEDYLSEDLLNRGLKHIKCDIDIRERANQKVMQFLNNVPDLDSFKNFIYENITVDDIKKEYFTVILQRLSEKL